ncbi:hypothetical protein R69746_08573 [Paraburkholderia aspalathi]|nr:hypothetical protein R69746_08573 [Paraburkholderia aspalathi]CAE6873769.1 hypothetical protein R75465_08462 [Paraburkholderia aspalathi]
MPRRMIDTNVALYAHFLELSNTRRVGTAPFNTLQDHFKRIVQPLRNLGDVWRRRRSWRRCLLHRMARAFSSILNFYLASVNATETMSTESTNNRRITEIINESLAVEYEDAKSAGMLGYMARAMVQATLPHSDPKTTYFERTNGLCHAINHRPPQNRPAVWFNPPCAYCVDLYRGSTNQAIGVDTWALASGVHEQATDAERWSLHCFTQESGAPAVFIANIPHRRARRRSRSRKRSDCQARLSILESAQARRTKSLGKHPDVDPRLLRGSCGFRRT